MINGRDMNLLNDIQAALSYKYIKNSKKGDPNNESLSSLWDKYEKELLEFKESIINGDLENAKLEIPDVTLFQYFIVRKIEYNIDKGINDVVPDQLRR